MSTGELLIAVLTVLCSGAAAFVGARVAQHSTEVEDRREREAAAWTRIMAWVTMACSTNPTEAYVGLYHLQQAKQDWTDVPEQREFIKRTLAALNAVATPVRTPSIKGGDPRSPAQLPTPAQVLAAQLTVDLQREDGELVDQALLTLATTHPATDQGHTPQQ